MSEEIIKVLDDLGNRLGIVIDWSNKNIVPYLEDLMTRFISFKNMQAIIWIIISLVIIGLSMFVLFKLIKWKKSDKFAENIFNDDGVVFLISIIVVIFLMLIFLIILFCNINGLFQNILIPEITMIDYINNYIYMY